MPITPADAEIFFARYVQTLLKQDLDRVARHWGEPAMFINDEGVRLLPTTADVRAFFETVLKGYALSYATFRLTEAEVMSDTVLRAVIDWTHFDANGAVVGRETSQYMLRKDGEDIRMFVHTPKRQRG